MTTAHNQPGRRLAIGSNRGDHLLALFHFCAHGAFFMALAAWCCWMWPDASWWLFVVSGVVTTVLIVIRGAQVGLTTTKESIIAIKEAWKG